MADTLVMPDEGKLVVANWWLGNGPAGGDQIELHLFQGTPGLSAATTAADFTAATFAGYAPKLKTYADFSAPAIVGGKGRVRFGGALQTFACTGAGGDVDGWYLLDTVSGKVLFACQYDTTVSMINGAQHRLDTYVDTDIS